MRTRVYYADTDAGGVVYYANYLRWLEMARYEWVDDLGLSVAEYARQGTLFAVVRIEADYHAPALLGDTVEIATEVERVRRVRFTLVQRVHRVADQKQLVSARVVLACVSATEERILPLPAALAVALKDRLSDG